jgi:hypothetical protein
MPVRAAADGDAVCIVVSAHKAADNGSDTKAQRKAGGGLPIEMPMPDPHTGRRQLGGKPSAMTSANLFVIDNRFRPALAQVGDSCGLLPSTIPAISPSCRWRRGSDVMAIRMRVT